jgi:hypothetical protein
MAPRTHRDYTSTVRDLKALIASEAEGDRRAALTKNIDMMNSEITRLRDSVDGMGALKAKVEGLTWLVRTVIIGAVLEIIVGVVVALLMKGAR